MKRQNITFPEMKLDLSEDNLKHKKDDLIKEQTGFDISSYREVLKLQDFLNSKIGADWKDKKLNWQLALVLENAELLDSLDWKWWKKMISDMDNVEIEMVDLFHFLLSKLLEEGKEESIIAFLIAKDLEQKAGNIAGPATGKSTDEYLIRVMGGTFFQLVLSNSYIQATMTFLDVWFALGNTTDDLFRKYKMKYTLNMFRKENGYKDGTYIKIWGDVEDNVFAQKLQLNIKNDSDYIENLTDALSNEYQNHKNSDIKKDTKITMDEFIKGSPNCAILLRQLPSDVMIETMKMMELYKSNKTETSI